MFSIHLTLPYLFPKLEGPRDSVVREVWGVVWSEELLHWWAGRWYKLGFLPLLLGG
jgi:hypothetical protein